MCRTKLEKAAVYSFVNDACLGIGGKTFGTIVGEAAELRAFKGDLDQLFRVAENGNGTYKLENMSSGLYLSVSGDAPVLTTESDPGVRVFPGVFGGDMKVEIVNDGPITILVDTEEF